MRNLKAHFITGIIVLLPAVATAYILWTLFKFIDGLTGRFIYHYIDLPGLGMVMTLLVILFTGFLARNFIGKRLIIFFENIIINLPIVRSIYGTVKQIIDTILQSDKKAFKQVVLIEYPRKGIYAMAFLTAETKGEIRDRIENEMLNVFLPTTPNPTSGFLLFVPKDEVIFLDMSIEDGIKLIISGGVLTPSQNGKGR